MAPTDRAIATCRAARATAGEIPTSPMAVLAFLLVVYFVLTATLASTRGLDCALPPDEEEPAEAGELGDRLLPVLERNPRKSVTLRSDDEAPCGAVVDALDGLGRLEDRHHIDIHVSIPTRREVELYWHGPEVSP